MIFVLSLLLAISAKANPNILNNVNTRDFDAAATLARHFQDDWGNHYYLSWAVHGSVRGHLDSTLCPTTQSALGKEVDGKLYLIIDATQMGECVGGFIVADRQGASWVGEWRSPVTGAPTPVTLGVVD
jgi:hypothetical protein